MIAVISLITALLGLAGAVINSLGWRRHAAEDDARFAEVNTQLNERGE